MRQRIFKFKGIFVTLLAVGFGLIATQAVWSLAPSTQTDEVLRAIKKQKVSGRSPIAARQKWSRDALIAAIREREAKGKPLNAGAVKQDDPALHEAARRWFQADGGWEGALRAAGKSEEQIAAIRGWRAWDRDLIVQAIREREASKQSLNPTAVQQEDTGLYQTAVKFFKTEGGWKGALRAAGKTEEEIASVHERQVWSRDSVIAAIRDREAKGKALNARAVEQDDTSLYKAARQWFQAEGGWNGALLAAGKSAEDIAAIRQQRIWDRDSLIEAIRTRDTGGKPLNAKAVQLEDLGLYATASKWFEKEGGWEGALRAAGKSEKEIEGIVLQRTWDRDAVIQAILERESDGKPLNVKAIQEDDNALYGAAYRLFRDEGGWEGALLAAGKSEEDIAAIRGRQSWDRDRVIQAIHQREASGKPLNAGAVLQEDGALYQAGVKYFKTEGGWEGALRAAGKSDAEIIAMRGKRIWDRDAVILAIKERESSGKALNTTAVLQEDKGLYRAAVKWFKKEGGWKGALRAAGKSEEEITAIWLQRSWDRDAVIRGILEREATGKPLNAGAVVQEDGPLYQAALKYFRTEGGWEGALRAAGKNEEEIAAMRRKRTWDRDAIVRAIRERAVAGKGLNSKAVRDDDPGLYAAAGRTWFKAEGGWEGALIAAGYDPEKIFITPKALRAKFKHTGQLLPENVSLCDPAKFGLVDIQNAFNTWDRRLKALEIEQKYLSVAGGLSEMAITSVQPFGARGDILIVKLRGNSKRFRKGDLAELKGADGGYIGKIEIDFVRGSEIQGRFTEGKLGAIRSAVKLAKEEIDIALRQEIEATKLIHAALGKVAGAKMGKLGHPVWNKLLRLESPPPTKPEALMGQSIQWLDEEIEADDSQKVAVQIALNPDSPVAVIWGPPGTGKTQVITEIARQFARQGKRVLIASQMNVAVDEAVARLISLEDFVPLLRLANSPDRISEEVKPVWIGDAKHRTKAVVAYDPTERRGIIVGGTSVGVQLDRELQRLPQALREFDVVILDEASRDRWSGATIPLLMANEKAIIVGDPKQLPPLENYDVKKILQTSGFDADAHYRGMLDDMVDSGFDQVLLSTNYRSHPLIAGLVSRLFYQDRIATRELEEDPILEDTVKIIDTSQQSRPAHEIKESEEELANPFEAELTVQEAMRLMAEGVPAEDITFITPYAAQVNKICMELAKPENGFSKEQLNILQSNVKTVDSFQGGQNRVTILSFVRSNKQRPNVGFLKDLRRLNVAMSRAQERLIMIGDLDTLKNTKRTPEDLQVGEIFRELEKYNEEVVKVAVAAVAPQNAKVYLSIYGQGAPTTKPLNELLNPIVVMDEVLESGA